MVKTHEKSPHRNKKGQCFAASSFGCAQHILPTKAVSKSFALNIRQRHESSRFQTYVQKNGWHIIASTLVR